MYGRSIKPRCHQRHYHNYYQYFHFLQIYL